ncbi:hypothetical protein M5D96_000555 [Drosophila gunungcola]|uniref:Uncharacterized protein n=1 Tax=Drosophila gunungcola TaxID=103775 RepID=A0A9P9YWJ2_9MUSC|nr:hypothetical protein M5D96_000555 [Drosophila gunungcola]
MRCNRSRSRSKSRSSNSNIIIVNWLCERHLEFPQNTCRAFGPNPLSLGQ